MAYIKRISDDRIFEVFGAESQQHLRGREVVTAVYFFLYDAEATEDANGDLCDGVWQWHLYSDFLPLEVIELEDTTPEGTYDMQDIEEDIPTSKQEDIKEDIL